VESTVSSVLVVSRNCGCADGLGVRRDERFQNLTSMAFTSRGTSEVLVGGAQLQLFTVNLGRGTIGSEVGAVSGLDKMRERSADYRDMTDIDG